MSFLSALASFLGNVLKHILPGLISKWQQARETEVLGNTKELTDDINQSIEDEISSTTLDDDGDFRV